VLIRGGIATEASHLPMTAMPPRLAWRTAPRLVPGLLVNCLEPFLNSLPSLQAFM
jgi:hypothetical protein